MKDVFVLTKYAKEMILEGNYDNAKKALVKAAKLDSQNHNTFILLGDVYYLLKDLQMSVKSYLAAIHIQICKMKNLPSTTFTGIIQLKYDKLPQEAKDLLPDMHGLIIFDDTIVPSHMAHSFIDLKGDISDPIMLECSMLYEMSLKTQKPTTELIDNFNICHEDYLSFEESHYITVGRELLVDSIAWDKIHLKDVINIYFK